MGASVRSSAGRMLGQGAREGLIAVVSVMLRSSRPEERSEGLAPVVRKETRRRGLGHQIERGPQVGLNGRERGQSHTRRVEVGLTMKQAHEVASALHPGQPEVDGAQLHVILLAQFVRKRVEPVDTGGRDR